MTTGKDIAKYAKKWVGKGSYYKLGGTDVTGPCDCSGFVWRVYKHFYPDRFAYRDTAKGYASYGKKVPKSKLQPGDLVCMHTGWRGYEAKSVCDHVGVYVGDGVIVQCGHNYRQSGIYTIKYANCKGIILYGRRIASSVGTTAKKNYTRYRTTDDLNVRTGAGTNYKVKTSVPSGIYIKIYKTKNGWGYSKALKGWLSMKYLKKVK